MGVIENKVHIAKILLGMSLFQKKISTLSIQKNLPHHLFYPRHHFIHKAFGYRVVGVIYCTIGGVHKQAHCQEILIVFAGIVLAQLPHLIICQLYCPAHGFFLMWLYPDAVAAPRQP